MSSNEKVIQYIKKRLDKGQIDYKQDIPLNGENGRDNLLESMDEALDLSIYLAASILEMINKRDNLQNNKGDDVEYNYISPNDPGDENDSSK
jgi:hypothetical protein